MANDETPYVPPRSGVWIAASLLFQRDVPGGEPYPCLCGTVVGCERQRNPRHCWCHGRTDVYSHLPRQCCAVRRAAIARLSRKDPYL